jgi:hypothetical protein
VRWLLALVVACGGGKAPEPVTPTTAAPPADAPAPAFCVAADCAADQMKQFTEAVCACADSACATKLNQDFTAWGAAMAKANVAMPEDQSKQITELATRFMDCYQNLYIAPK